MSKNSVVVRTPQDLERKYNFASLLGLKKNVEITSQGIQKIENELNNMLNTLTINLKGVLDSQSDVSLWFYSGIPTTSNEPYTTWGNPDDHIGDIYYDQSSGMVYQFNGEWELNEDPNLVEAMAITNAEIDTEGDRERKVFFDTPTPPYSNGDWWIKEDGSLFICQISKPGTEVYENNDFIIANQYVNGTFATKVNERLTIIEGTVTTIEESNDNINIQITTQQKIVEGLENDVTTLENSNSELNNRVSGVENSNTDLSNRVSGAESNISNLEQSNTTLTGKVNEVEQSNSSLNDKVTGLEESNNTLNNRVGEVETSNTDLSNRVGEVETSNADLSTKIDDVEASNNTLIDRVTGVEANNTTLTDKVTEVEQTNSDLSNKVNSVEETTDTLNNELKQQQEAHQDLSDKVTGLGGILEDMTFNFSTKGLSVATSLDPNNSVLDNRGIKVYNYNKLNAIFNNKGSGIDKLIVTGTAQMGHLRITKSTKNGKKATKIFHLDKLVEDLSDLEV